MNRTREISSFLNFRSFKVEVNGQPSAESTNGLKLSKLWSFFSLLKYFGTKQEPYHPLDSVIAKARFPLGETNDSTKEEDLSLDRNCVFNLIPNTKLNCDRELFLELSHSQLLRLR